MNKITTTALMLAVLVGVGAAGLGATDASAHFGGGEGKGNRLGMHKNIDPENALVPQELRSEWRSEKRAMFEDMTQEERQAYREEHRAERQAFKEERKESFEDFVGLEREEIKELKQDGATMGEILEDQGVTEGEAEDFLTDRANEKVDYLVEKHDLDSTDEQTLRDRIANFVQSVLDKWFATA